MSRIYFSVSLHLLLLQHPEVDSSSLLVFMQHEIIQSPSVIPIRRHEFPLHNSGEVLKPRRLWHTFNSPSWSSRKTRARQSTSQSFIAVVQRVWRGHREGGRGRQVRFFTGTCRLQRHSLDFQLHPQQRQGATKKGKESLQSPSVNSPRAQSGNTDTRAPCWPRVWITTYM